MEKVEYTNGDVDAVIDQHLEQVNLLLVILVELATDGFEEFSELGRHVFA